MNRNGITLIEIMILVAIIGLLLAIAVPSFVKAKRTQELKDAGYTDKDQISSLVSTNEEAFDLAIKNGPRSMDKTKGDGKHDEWGHSEDGQAASRPQANGHPSVDVGHRARQLELGHCAGWVGASQEFHPVGYSVAVRIRVVGRRWISGAPEEMNFPFIRADRGRGSCGIDGHSRAAGFKVVLVGGVWRAIGVQQ